MSTPAGPAERPEPAASDEPAQARARSRPPRSLRRMFAAVVLVGELFVVGFAVLAARATADVPDDQVLLAGAALALLAVTAAATLRSPLGYGLGWLLQVLLVAGGYWLPMMAVVGLVFAGIWVLALAKGGQADLVTARRQAAAADAASQPPR